MVTTPWRRRREHRLAELDRFRTGRRLADEDVTVLGEQLAELHLDTLTAPLDPASRDDYTHALDRYEDAKRRLARAEDLDAVEATTTLVADARFHRACVLARVHGEALPTRRDSCFFNPQHLPAVADVAWAPPGGVQRRIAVCPSCRGRLEHGEAPDARLVRVGDRWVTWWVAGGSLVDVVATQRAIVHGTYSTDALVAEAHARASLHRLGDAGAGAGGST